MKIFHILLAGFGGIVVIIIILDLPEMGGLLTYLRLILAAFIIGLVWTARGAVVDLFDSGENDK
ncbi:MAG: hypothetical protein K9N46_13225 [Candidatus Marinimicrobia bacterium]|nr:hypothetical protein [Candidatus Neomarinimicrobiota bacterium]MCF7829744.1 hypothetical protein [Candidatus Neomarinimicrobiota bacterium]MCF7881694.1 hypothetical protein [Candidatus Neomarinimicrobiota bacterium]